MPLTGDEPAWSSANLRAGASCGSMRGVKTSTNVSVPRLVRSVELTRPQSVGVMLLACFPLPLLSLGAMVVPLPEIIERAAAGFIPFASLELEVKPTGVAPQFRGKRRAVETGVGRADVRSGKRTPVPRSSTSTSRAKEVGPTSPAVRPTVKERSQPVSGEESSPDTTPASTDAPKEPVTDPAPRTNPAAAEPAETDKGHASRGKSKDDQVPLNENGGGSEKSNENGGGSKETTPGTPPEPPDQSGGPGGSSGSGSGGNSGGGHGGSSRP